MDDTKEFEEAQESYLENHDRKSWDIMFIKVFKCCDVYIRKWLMRYSIILDNNDRDDFSRDAASKIMRRYIKIKDYKILNLPTVCKLATLNEVYNKKTRFYRENVKSFSLLRKDLKEEVKNIPSNLLS